MGYFSLIVDLDIAGPVTEHGQVGNSRTASPFAHGRQSDGAMTASPSSNSASTFAEEDAAEARLSITQLVGCMIKPLNQFVFYMVKLLTSWYAAWWSF